MCIVCPSFAYNSRFEQLRKYLVENNYLDTLVFLPGNIFYGTSTPSILIVCKRFRGKDEPIKMFNAKELYLEDKRFKHKFDYKLFKELFEEGTCPEAISVSKENMRRFEYNLNFEIYSLQNISIKEGQKKVMLSELLEKVQGTICETKGSENMISLKSMSNNFIEILLNKDKVSQEEKSRLTTYRLVASEGSFLANTRSGVQARPKFALHTDNNTFMCSSMLEVWKINTDVIIPEYLVYILTTNNVLKKCEMPFGSCMKLPIVIENKEKQLAIVEKLTQEYNEKVKAEQEADAKRLGIKQNISDLEHMLGTTQFKINQMIARLERITPDSEKYSSTVKSLKDNFKYMNRLIHFSNEKIADDSFNKKEVGLAEFVNSYTDSWNNYGGNYFHLTVDNELIGTDKVLLDTNLFTVLLDAILNNAAKHSFHKRNNYTENNLVEIQMELVEYQNKPYFRMGIANNGDPIKEGFTIDDYISRGRFTAETGRSGLGGYHVYKIVKGHNGFLNIDSNKNWNVIINVLLPVEVNESLTLPVYEQECV